MFRYTCRFPALILLASLAHVATPAAHAQFQVTVQGNNNVGINDINAAELVLANGTPEEAGGLFSTINFPAFPVGTPADTFALEAVGVVDVVGGTSTTLSFFVNSDDGFRLRNNGVTIFEFAGQTGGSNATSAPVTVNDGDVLRLTYFENFGGEVLTFRNGSSNGALIGTTASGILITPVQAVTAAPEPGTIALLGLGLLPVLGAVARRRRQF